MNLNWKGGFTNNIASIVATILPIPFCFLTLFALVYYIRRRYILYKEKKNIPSRLQSMESYQNHVKNLTIMGVINNFIIIILVLELFQNISFSIRRLPRWVELFDEKSAIRFHFLFRARYIIDIYMGALNISLVPILSLLMNYLWWAYRKYECKHLIFTWTICIILRALVVTFLTQHHFQPGIRCHIFSRLTIGLFYSIDLILFVYYYRRFYTLLKSREQEIRLFYFDKKAYLDSRNLRIHFKIASILVGISIILYTVGVGFLYPVGVLRCEHEKIYLVILNYVLVPVKTMYKIFINLNYTYMFLVILHKYLKNRKKLENINEIIRPLIDKYHRGVLVNKRCSA